MLNSTDTVFSLDNLFFERPDLKSWYLAPVPSISEIPATQELQKELGKNKPLEANPKSSACVKVDLTSKKQELLELNLEVDESHLQHEGLELVSSFLCFDHGKYKSEVSACQQPSRSISESKVLINFPEEGGDESPSTFRKRYVFLFRNIFKEFPYFNYIQSKALDDLLYTDRNFVICAPTGSGKTVMFELAITRLLMKVPMPWLNIKIVYMAPIKVLCSQRFDDWKEKFGPIGLICKELTGDTVMDDLFEIQHAHVIMTTPEKWDSMTRKWRDNSLVQLVRLFLIDEVHVVKDESRGATLEVVVSRMKTVQSSLSSIVECPDTVLPMRFVAVSATIPNAEDVRVKVSFHFILHLYNFKLLIMYSEVSGENKCSLKCSIS
uniref:Helicase ATP-binding domain-containing protein n=1 Tax=Sphenodon punctatus TaxID=8508 RepID=A0A8D0GBW4_SPHPU